MKIMSVLCQRCGEIFKVEREGPGALPSYCDDCRGKKKNKEIMITCKQCGTEFPFQTRVGKPPACCSSRCRTIYKKAYRKQYYQKQYSEEPAITITDHINRINKRPCIRCGNEKSVTVQMIQGREEIGNMIPLCLECGSLYHDQEWNISEIEDKLKEQYPDQYWWLQIEKSENLYR